MLKLTFDPGVAMNPVIAIIDLNNVSLYDETNPGIDFFNEIDIWARMEFRSRGQINRLRHKKTLKSHGSAYDLHPLYYSLRHE